MNTTEKIKALITECRGKLPEEIKNDDDGYIYEKEIGVFLDITNRKYLSGINYILQKELETRELIASNIELLLDRCDTCRIFNPQHKDCTWCDDHETLRETVLKALSMKTPITWDEIVSRLEG